MTVQLRGVNPFERTNAGTSVNDVQVLSRNGAEHVVGSNNVTNSNLSYLAGQGSGQGSIHCAAGANSSPSASVPAPAGCGSNVNYHA